MVDDHCKRYETECPRNPGWMEKEEKICGFDDVEYELAEFDELCTLHKVDCQMHRVFRKINMEVCDARKLFDEQYPAQASDYTKRERSTKPGSTPLWTPPTSFKHKPRKIKHIAKKKPVTRSKRSLRKYIVHNLPRSKMWIM